MRHGVFFKYISIMRPRQWIKNLIIFFPAFFGGLIVDVNILEKLILGFFLFSFVSSAGYIINDIKDIEKDKFHPIKKFRAIASGKVSKKTALIIASVLLFIGLFGSFFLNKLFFLITFIYFINTTVYSFFFKKIPYLDLFIIALGFIFRLYAGYALSHLPLSWWLVFMTVTVAIMLGAGKRLEEIRYQEQNETNFRDALIGYNEKMVTSILVYFAFIALLAFGFYLFYKKRFDIFLFSVSIVLVLNYINSAIKKNLGEPSDFFIKNKVNIALLAVWALLFFIKIYF